MSYSTHKKIKKHTRSLGEYDRIVYINDKLPTLKGNHGIIVRKVSDDLAEVVFDDFTYGGAKTQYHIVLIESLAHEEDKSMASYNRSQFVYITFNSRVELKDIPEQTEKISKLLGGGFKATWVSHYFLTLLFDKEVDVTHIRKTLKDTSLPIYSIY